MSVKKSISHKNLVSFSDIESLFEIKSVQYLFVARSATHRAIVVSNYLGDYQLHAVDFQTGFHRQITHKKGGALFGSISPDGNYVYILNDEYGGEHGHFIRVPFEGGKSINISPNLKPYFSYSVSANNDAETLCFVAAIGTKNKVYISKRNIEDKFTVSEMYSANASLSEPICSLDGKYTCVAKTDVSTKSSTLLIFSNQNSESKLESCSFSSVTPLAFSSSPGKTVILALARSKNWLRPVFYDFVKKQILEITHSSFCGDVWVLGWNENRGEIILCDVYQAEQKLYIYNTSTKQLRRTGPKTGSFNFHFDSAVWLGDKSIILRWSDFNTSPRLIQIRAPKYNSWNEISKWSGNISSNYAIKSIWTSSSDGEAVQMWIVRPHGTKKPLPFVIDMHGGPHGVTGNEFSPEAQSWLQNGFGFCSVNYRGSISFGKKFERRIYGNPGNWEVEDIVAAEQWLIKNKYANKKDIILYGWSWGGYAALLALGKYPDLWKCGVAGGAIADFVMQYKKEPAYFKALDQEKFGGTLKTAFSRYVRSSPITYANYIKVPIFLLHGKNDVRCLPDQITHFVDKLKKIKKDISIEWFASGHIGGFTDTKLRVKLIKKILSFVINK